MLDFLKNCELFVGLNDRQLGYFLPNTFERKYNPNEVVFFCNDPSQALYIVKSGQVMLTLDIQDKFERIGLLEEYDFFGENSILMDARRIYNAICEDEEVSLMIIPKVHIREIFIDHPRVKATMLENLCEVFNERYDKIFSEYKSSLGFFELGRVFRRHRIY